METNWNVWEVGRYLEEYGHYAYRLIASGLTKEQAESRKDLSNMGSDCFTYVCGVELPEWVMEEQ